ncbi:MAG TPA: Grx4 family monothiol glutaredoxin [Kofleriaceae bacterium]|jgi:monothiol glutaredoxin|nr:Grx4 family monothiol glutaredoxin [Kofleriaceae bacterium]
MTLDPETRKKIEDLVASDPVVLFMKGNRSFPQCGFSASVVNILNTLIPKYATVNILADANIRTGMKDFSDWPTFPQLFIRGEFVGGADIVRQMHESGDLEKKLGDLVAPAKAPSVTVSPRAGRELAEALKEGSPGDVIHLTITPGWEHQLDLGPGEPSHVTVESGGITVQLDRASAGRAAGVTIDFIEAADGAGFKIDNPNRPATVKEIAPKELKALLDSGRITHFYDVRPDKERSVASIAGVRQLDDAAMAAIEALPKDTPLAFHCHHGGRSRGAAEHFLKLGFKNVYNMAGGIEAWSRDIDPSVPRY